MFSIKSSVYSLRDLCIPCEKILMRRKWIRYSDLRLFTGFCVAALKSCPLNVITASITNPSPLQKNTHQLIDVRYAKLLSQLSTAHHASGAEMMKAMTMSRIKSNESNRTMLAIVAPNTFRMPISLVRASAV